MKRLWVRMGETLKPLRWTTVGRWWLAWVSGAATTRYHTLRPTASTRQHGPRSLAAIISERGRCTCLVYATSIQADHYSFRTHFRWTTCWKINTKFSTAVCLDPIRVPDRLLPSPLTILQSAVRLVRYASSSVRPRSVTLA